MRKALLITLLGLLAGCIYYTDLVLESHAWGTVSNGKFILVASGWSMLMEAWPMMLVGGLLGYITMIFFIGFGLYFAKEHDHRREIATYVFRAETAESKAAEVNKAIDESLKKREKQVNIQLKAAQELERSSKEHQKSVMALEARVKIELLQSKSKVEAAEKKATNAAQAYARIKAKQNRA